MDGARIRVFSSARAASAAAAESIAAILRRHGPRTLLLSTGKTMVPIYRELVRLHAAGRAPFSRAETFNLDELPVPPEDPRSFRAFMERHLLRRVGPGPARVNFLRGGTPRDRREAECARYERQLLERGPADLALVGIGANGHVAYLEPGRSLSPRTAVVRLSASTRRGLAADGMRPVPREALSMGIETILSARSILLVATGQAKAKAIAAALEGPVTPACPASYLSLHPGLEVVLDRGAATGL